MVARDDRNRRCCTAAFRVLKSRAIQESCLDATEALKMAARELSETSEVVRLTSATAAGPLEMAAQACSESADVAQPPLMCSK